MTPKVSNVKNHIKVAFVYFLIAAILGVLLRAFPSFGIPINYRYIVHTHSHIALLGWVYVALTTLIFKCYLQNGVNKSKHRLIFWFTQFTLIGMLLTFPFIGYAFLSILFSTLFLFASYGFAWVVLKNVNTSLKKTNSYICIKIALCYLILSSIGPWALGGIMTTLGPESMWYRMSIYFYLHFQYNGWMVMALVGLLFFILEQKGVVLSSKTFKNFYWSFNLGIVLTFLLSTLWIKQPPLVNYFLGGLGVLCQVWAFYILLRDTAIQAIYYRLPKYSKNILKTIGVLLFTKLSFQGLTALPYFANLAVTYLDFTIGYLHWTFLGLVTISLFALLDYFKLIKITQYAYSIYLTGFFITETLIFYKGLAGWKKIPIFEGYFDVLTCSSALISIAILYILAFNLNFKSHIN